MTSIDDQESVRRNVVVADEAALHQYMLSTLKQRLTANTLFVKKPMDTPEPSDTKSTTESSVAELQLILSRGKKTINTHVDTADIDTLLLEMRHRRLIENRPYIEASKVRWGFRDRQLEDQKKMLLDEAETRNDIETIELNRLESLTKILNASNYTTLAVLQSKETLARKAIEMSHHAATRPLALMLDRDETTLERLQVGDLASPGRCHRARDSLSPERLSPRRSGRLDFSKQ
jgi:hypothetical protein